MLEVGGVEPFAPLELDDDEFELDEEDKLEDELQLELEAQASRAGW